VGADAPSFVESSYGFCKPSWTLKSILNRSGPTSQGDLLVRFELVWKFRLATKQSKNCGVEVRVEDYPHQTGVCL